MPEGAQPQGPILPQYHERAPTHDTGHNLPLSSRVWRVWCTGPRSSLALEEERISVVSRKGTDEIESCSPLVVRPLPPDDGMGTTLEVSTRTSSLMALHIPFRRDRLSERGCGCNGG